MKLRFERKQREVEDIWSFFFMPVGNVTWKAGQSIRLELPRKSWGIDERRFTISSAPHEKLLRITTKISDSSFKQNLKRLRKGSVINGYNIEGDFLWEQSKKHRLFIAGGIGITPFRALIDAQIAAKKPLNTTLLYSFKTTQPVFERELNTWQSTEPGFQVIYLPNRRVIIDEHGTITDFWRQSLVYVSGPEKMVKAITRQLLAHGLPKMNIRIDLFTGLEF